MDRSCDSSPQSLTTTQEQFTTLRALPSRSSTPEKNSKVSSSSPKTIPPVGGYLLVQPTRRAASRQEP